MIRRTWHLAVVAFLVAAAFLVGAPTWAQGSTGQEMTPVDVVAKVGPAVVTVINEQTVSGAPGQNTGQVVPVGSGSGFIVDDQGDVVTNNHVVENGQSFDVIFADGTKRAAKLVGADPVSDLAVVRVPGKLPGTVPLGDSSKLKPGQSVLAMGSPLGSFTNTVTQGIVSNLGRTLPPDQTGGAVYTNLVQHDAAINPGNSGGPLFDLYGQVVGVNTIGIPMAEQGVPAQGLFFAIPSNTVKQIADQLIANGKVVYPYLGVINPVAVDPVTAAQHNLPVDHGVYVVGVQPASPAARAGLQSGDIITAINGQPIDQSHPFEEFLFTQKPGDTVELTVQRGTKEFKVEATLGARPSQ
jgi:2-alkenal reductase